MGRPPSGEDEVATRDRLIAASIEVFVEHGFRQASLTEIAKRAGISGPAVYKHFDGKADLLMQAARCSLDSLLTVAPAAELTPAETARRWLADDFAHTRRLLLELHLAAAREVDLASLLADWHRERTREWQSRHAYSLERIKAFYLLLLGLAHVDGLDSLAVEPDHLRECVDRMVGALFADPPLPCDRN